jgi:hypothetical protein
LEKCPRANPVGDPMRRSDQRAQAAARLATLFVLRCGGNKRLAGLHVRADNPINIGKVNRSPCVAGINRLRSREAMEGNRYLYTGDSFLRAARAD